MNINKTMIIDILDPQAGTLRETVLDDAPQAPEDNGLLEGRRSGRPVRLSEVATTSEFPALLRDGLKTRLFSTYARVPQTWNQFCATETSDRQSEDYLKDSGLGMAPEVSENAPYPEVNLDLDSVVTVYNKKRGYIIPITEEMVYFDRTSIMKQIVDKIARSMATTKEQLAYNVITTAGNFTRNSTTGDNDIGANTAATTWSASGLETCLSTINTSKDRKSGVYFNANANTVICGPRLQFAVKQLLLAPDLSGMGNTGAVLTYGTGTANPFRGVIDRIIVSPFIQSYAFVVLDRNAQPVVCQTVWPLQVLQTAMQGSADNYGYMHYDRIEYRARELYGFGMVADQFAYYSSSSTAPTVT